MKHGQTCRLSLTYGQTSADDIGRLGCVASVP
jgi:hypothetical protein